MRELRVVLVKPSKYAPDGSVERFKKGYIPNATLWHLASLTPAKVGGAQVSVYAIDEYVRQDLEYLNLLHPDPGVTTLVALVGVQSHQFHRALDLAAFALLQGVRCCVIGGPHVMTCDTTLLQGQGISFALAEAELIWQEILRDALDGELLPVYGTERRWAERLSNTVIQPPKADDLARYRAPMLGLYPVRGCPYRCHYCSVIKISGRQVRSDSLETTLESLRLAKRSGIQQIMFVSDNFNKYPEVRELLKAMIDERIDLPFFCQCDTQIAKDPELVELLGRAGCFEMFVGVESFNRAILKAVGKNHNFPEQYAEIVRLCNQAGIRPHFSNIIGFPEDDEQEIQHHLDVLKVIHPKAASFFILTPIPGTQQYGEFLRAGLITERNLDRFDATTLTWTHPKLSAKQLNHLLYYCYTNFHGHILRAGNLTETDVQVAVFNRYMAAQQMHPMAGGVEQVRLDGAAEYAELRKKVYDIDLVPLPENLSLSKHDEEMNLRADWRKKVVQVQTQPT